MFEHPRGAKSSKKAILHLHWLFTVFTYFHLSFVSHRDQEMIWYQWAPQMARESAPSQTRSTVSHQRLILSRLFFFFCHPTQTMLQSLVAILSQVAFYVNCKTQLKHATLIRMCRIFIDGAVGGHLDTSSLMMRCKSVKWRWCFRQWSKELLSMTKNVRGYSMFINRFLCLLAVVTEVIESPNIVC